MENIVAAVITAVPPTIASVLAWRKASHASAQVTPSNGTRTAGVVERTELKVDQVSKDVRELRGLFIDHTQRPDAHHGRAVFTESP